uniref:VPS8 subunit of CORVET complex n=1 Tax=Pan paniscus TaxID=9597 RepID=A0A2R9BQI6_PANPA
MENEPDHENVEQSLCAKTSEEELNKSFNLEASLSKFSYIDLDKELEFKNDLGLTLLSRLEYSGADIAH